MYIKHIDMKIAHWDNFNCICMEWKARVENNILYNGIMTVEMTGPVALFCLRELIAHFCPTKPLDKAH